MYFSKPFARLFTLKGLPYNSTHYSVSFLSSLSLKKQVFSQEVISFNEFIEAFKFTKNQSSYVEKRLASVRSPDIPFSVLTFLQSLGFSETQIKSIVRGNPQILCSNVKRSLSPKVEFFQKLGLVGSDLGKFLARHPGVLTASVEKSLVPGIDNLRKILQLSNGKEGLVEVLQRCGSLFRRRPESILENVALFESCGIDRSQISKLLRRQPRLFIASPHILRDLVTRAKDMGAATNSGMFVHAIHSLSCVSAETYRRKRELFCCFGFDTVEIMRIFTRAPTLLRTSEEKLKLGLEFFLHKMKLDKSVLLFTPTLLMYNIEKRVIPRSNVWLLIKAKKLQRKEPKLSSLMHIPEDKFVQRFILQFDEDVEELLMAYKGQYLGATSGEKSQL